MKKRFRLLQRGERGRTFYCFDTHTHHRTSLGTKNPEEAERLVQAKNDALRQPQLNLHIAKAYLVGIDSGIATRTWQHALNALIDSKQGENQARWQRAAKDKALDHVRDRVIIETQAEQLLQVLKSGTVSSNVFLRKLHNFCLNMNWLPWPILPKAQWPPIRFKSKRAITAQEHQAIITRERNPERRAFYQLCWHLGGSQSDIASLHAEDVDWREHTIAYRRKKTQAAALLHFGADVEAILRILPQTGLLFPRLAVTHEKHRAKDFKIRCQSVGIEGVTLHSYRYAWAERARSCGYPERFAQEALGHNSAAVHRAYAKNARVKLPPLEEYERLQAEEKVIAVEFKKVSRTPRTANLPVK
jgi:integrase